MTDRNLQITAWVIIMLSATAVAVMSMRFFLPSPPNVGPEIMENFEAHRAVFLAHITASLIALLIGPWQFVAKIRQKLPHVHRWTGRLYVASVAVGGVGGFIVAWTSVAGLVVSFGFAILAVLWLTTTLLAFQSARARRFAAHRKWMIRSFALAAAAITLRLGLPIAPALGYEFMTGYIIMSWACWIINGAIAEIYLRRGFRHQSPSSMTA